MSKFSPNYTMGAVMDADYPIFIWHDGTPLADGTAVIDAHVDVTNNDTEFTLYITTSAASSAADTRLGASGIIAHATWGTWGLIAQEINSVAGWHAVLRDALFDDLPDHLELPTTKTSCFHKAVGISQDTSDDKVFGVGIVNFEAGTSMKGVQACLYHFTGQMTATTPWVNIYDCDDEAGTEQKVYYFLLTTGTEHSFPLYGPNLEPAYVAKAGHRILVRIEGAATPSACRLEVIGGLREVMQGE